MAELSKEKRITVKWGKSCLVVGLAGGELQLEI